MPIKMKIDKGRVPIHVWTDDIDAAAIEQLLNVARLPVVHGHVAAMPDVHVGIGATVGSVIPLKHAIIPAAVGVDIGCGMAAVRLSLQAKDLPDNLARLRSEIEAAVPVGFAMHEPADAPRESARRLEPRLRELLHRYPVIGRMQKSRSTWARQLGTLGGGNHFIELCLDEVDQVWVMLHSGSRGIGNVIGRHFIELAKQDAERHQQRLPDRNLAYFEEGADHFAAYVEAVGWAQDYARENRQAMMERILIALSRHLPEFSLLDQAINCHHNYVQKEMHDGVEVYITRKGAIRAGLGDLGIIPGSMGAKSYIVRGRGASASFCSCSHGAGRRLSRTQAKARFSAADLVAQTQGIECRKDAGVVDEAPLAYKPIDEVMANQSDLVEIVHTLKQVLCVKG